MPKSNDPRHSYEYRKLRTAYIAAARERDDACVICGRPIDWTASGREPYGPTVEHVATIAEHPALALEVDLWRTSHNRCNVTKGARLGSQRRNSNAPVYRPATADRW